jgi:hypothetical protein
MDEINSYTLINNIITKQIDLDVPNKCIHIKIYSIIQNNFCLYLH